MRYVLSVVCALASGVASAQAAPEPPAAAAVAADSGVLVYPPAFFASSNPRTALDMIQRLPGFTLDIGDVDSRGLAGASGNVLIDGARASSKSDTLAEVLGRIPASSVARIELIRGGAAGIDMRGRAVIANVVVKAAPVTQIAVESNTFVYDDGAVGPYAKASYSRHAGERQTEGSISIDSGRTGSTTQGFRDRRDGTGALLQRAALDLRDRYRNYDARGAIQRPLFGGKLHANAVLSRFAVHGTQITTILAGTGTDELVRERSAFPSGELGFTWTRGTGPRSELEVTGLQRLNGSTYSGTYESGLAQTQFDSRTTGGESVLRITDSFRPNARWSFQGGGEIAYNFLDTKNRYAANGVTVPLPNASVLVSEIRGEAFGQATWHPSPKLTVDATLRVELSRISQSGALGRTRSFSYPKPRVQVTWLPGEGHQLRFKVEQLVGQLDFGDFAASTEIALGTVAAGNADLRPASSTLFEAVYERRFWNKGVFELTLQHKELYDVIETIPLVGGFDATGNIGDGHANYAQGALTLPFEKLGVKDALLKLNASWVDSRVIDPLTGVERRRANQSPFGCSIGFTHDVKGGRFSYGFDHGCVVNRYRGYRTAEERVTRDPPYASVYAQWKPSASLTLRLDLGNLVNGERATLRNVYAGRRDITPLLYREDRATRSGRYAYFQVRKTL